MKLRARGRPWVCQKRTDVQVVDFFERELGDLWEEELRVRSQPRWAF